MKTLTSLLLCLVAISFTASAATTLPDYYPKGFLTWGKIVRLDLDHHVAIVRDKKIKFTPQARVYTFSTQYGTVSQLQEGMTIGVKMKSRQTAVADIWVLPEDYEPDYSSLFSYEKSVN